MGAIIIALPLWQNFSVLAQEGQASEEIKELNSKIQERKDKIKELEKTIESYKRSIRQKQTEAVSLRNQLSILDNHVDQLKTEIELTEEKIKQAKLEIEALELSITAKQQAIEKEKRIIAKMMREINADKQKGYLEILLTNKSFSEFYNQVQYLENVYTDLGRSAKTIRLAKEDLQSKKEQVENRKKMYDNLKEELEGRKGDLLEDTFVKQSLLIQTKSSEMQYQTLLTSLRRQYQQIEDEVKGFENEVRKKLAASNKLSAGSTDFDWPVPGRFITALFHDPEYPYRKVFEHSGIDIRAKQGTPIQASASGYVARAKRCSSASCYSYTLIVHPGNLSTLYGHMSSISVAEDQFVAKGDIIGYSGGTPGTAGAGPFVTGPHLHFEIRQSGIPVDPQPYLP